MNNAEWQRRDLEVLWHPCSQMKDHEDVFPMIPIRRGEGVWLEDFDGNRYMDSFVVRDGKIVSTNVWNDSAEIILSRAGLAEAPL